MITTFDKIVNDLAQLDFFSGYKFRKRDYSLFFKTESGKQFIELDHWRDRDTTSSLVIYPIYGVRFDILHKWFEKFSVKTLQDQRDRASISFSGSMLGLQDELNFDTNGDGYSNEFENFQIILECAEYVFSEYSSLDKLYNKTILPVLDGETELPDVGADWIFIDMALCKLVAPANFDKLKQIILSHVEKMYAHQEPNILDYYDRFEDIFHYLEHKGI